MTYVCVGCSVQYMYMFVVVNDRQVVCVRLCVGCYGVVTGSTSIFVGCYGRFGIYIYVCVACCYGRVIFCGSTTILTRTPGLPQTDR